MEESSTGASKVIPELESYREAHAHFRHALDVYLKLSINVAVLNSGLLTILWYGLKDGGSVRPEDQDVVGALQVGIILLGVVFNLGAFMTFWKTASVFRALRKKVSAVESGGGYIRIVDLFEDGRVGGMIVTVLTVIFFLILLFAWVVILFFSVN